MNQTVTVTTKKTASLPLGIISLIHSTKSATEKLLGKCVKGNKEYGTSPLKALEKAKSKSC